MTSQHLDPSTTFRVEVFYADGTSEVYTGCALLDERNGVYSFKGTLGGDTSARVWRVALPGPGSPVKKISETIEQ